MSYVFVAVLFLCFLIFIIFSVIWRNERQDSGKDIYDIKCWLDSENEIRVKFISKVGAHKFDLNKGSLEWEAGKIDIKKEKVLGDNNSLFIIKTSIFLFPDRLIFFKYRNVKYQVVPRYILNLTKYYYSENDLGCNYAKDKTIFKLWSPTALRVSVCIYSHYAKGIDSFYEAINMERASCGVWEGICNKDLKGKYYLYRIEHYLDCEKVSVYVADPYSKASSPNSKKSFIFDPCDINCNGWSDDSFVDLDNNVDAVIYELHVRDYTIDKSSGVSDHLKGKFSGLVEKRSMDTNGLTTSFDHIRELGVTHVHMLPTYDYATGNETEMNNLYTWYNWGYDPVLYFNIEGSYSVYPNGISRLSEYRTMVKAFHDNGIGVVHDIVFNHTYQTGNKEFSIFDKIVPGYFYRVDDDGVYSNGSGCGNEIATERPMVRKFIIDNLCYWTKYFHIDGFRFDLMGLIDKKTMIAAYKAVRELNHNAIFYGEGWNMSGCMMPEVMRMNQNNAMNTGIAAFNDGIRDNLTGDVFNQSSIGFVQSGKPLMGITSLKNQICGKNTGRDSVSISVAHPNEVVNYAGCHDNLTLWDKLKRDNVSPASLNLKRMDMLAFSIIITSQGIPFFTEGDEFGRTKNGNKNSYNTNDPDVNPIDWELKNKNIDMFNFYKSMIRLRSEHPAFRMTSSDMIAKHLKFIENTPGNIIAYLINKNANGDKWETILVAFNAGREDWPLSIEGKWNIVVDGTKFDKNNYFMLNRVTIPAIGTLIAYNNKD